MGSSLELVHLNLANWALAVLVFGTLLLILSKFAWGPILKALDERDDRIREDLDRAENARKEAEVFLADQRKAISELKEEGRKIREEARSAAESQRQDLLNSAREDAEAIIVQAKLDIGREKQAALDEVKSLAVSVGVGLARKILVQEIDPQRHKTIIEDAIRNIDKGYGKAG
ncbi:MAG: F0F1 ATP synthase subunit B [Planctomycetes bacterium]|nr:F0F1 ATP synthase subunit B [Planctomycetota bacterium]